MNFEIETSEKKGHEKNYKDIKSIIADQESQVKKGKNYLIPKNRSAFSTAIARK